MAGWILLIMPLCTEVVYASDSITRPCHNVPKSPDNENYLICDESGLKYMYQKLKGWSTDWNLVKWSPICEADCECLEIKNLQIVHDDCSLRLFRQSIPTGGAVIEYWNDTIMNLDELNLRKDTRLIFNFQHEPPEIVHSKNVPYIFDKEDGGSVKFQLLHSTRSLFPVAKLPETENPPLNFDCTSDDRDEYCARIVGNIIFTEDDSMIPPKWIKPLKLFAGSIVALDTPISCEELKEFMARVKGIDHCESCNELFYDNQGENKCYDFYWLTGKDLRDFRNITTPYLRTPARLRPRYSQYCNQNVPPAVIKDCSTTSGSNSVVSTAGPSSDVSTSGPSSDVSTSGSGDALNITTDSKSTSGPEVVGLSTSGPDDSTSGSDGTTSGPANSTSGPLISTSGPDTIESSTSAPLISTSDAYDTDSSTSGPGDSTSGPDGSTSSPLNSTSGLDATESSTSVPDDAKSPTSGPDDTTSGHGATDHSTFAPDDSTSGSTGDIDGSTSGRDISQDSTSGSDGATSGPNGATSGTDGSTSGPDSVSDSTSGPGGPDGSTSGPDGSTSAPDGSTSGPDDANIPTSDSEDSTSGPDDSASGQNHDDVLISDLTNSNGQISNTGDKDSSTYGPENSAGSTAVLNNVYSSEYFRSIAFCVMIFYCY